MAENKLIYTIASSKNFSANFNVNATAPLDTRTVVQNKADLYDVMGTFNGYVYEGMLVTVLAEKAVYQLIAIDTVNTKEKIVAAFKTNPDEFSQNAQLWQQVGKEADLSKYDTSSQVSTKISNAINALDSSNTAPSGHYITGITQTDGKISSITYTNLPGAPTLSDLGGITPAAVDTKISTAISGLDATYTAPSSYYITGITQTDGKISSITYTNLPAAPTLSQLGGITPAAVDTKISTAISGLDASDAAQSGYYVSYVSQADGKISVGREKLPTVEFAEGTYKGNLGMTYNGVGIDGTPTYTDIPVTISYKDSKVTGVSLPLDSFVKKNYVDDKISYEISSHDLVDKKYVDDKYDALIGDGKLNDTIDTIKEISYWLDNNPDDAVELTLSLAELTEKVNTNEKTVATDLNEIHTQLDNRYTKSEIDNTLTSYAKSANVYTKTEVNNTLASYASISYVNTRLSWGVI